jgi:predicted DNA-binding protein with PD1-like motif
MSGRAKRQPGPPELERIKWVEARGRAFEFTLEAGLPLLEAVRRGFEHEGFVSGTIALGALALQPFAYVIPSLPTTSEFVAYYSDTFRPEGVTRLIDGAMTFGTRDGAPFFHCHALWHEADGKLMGGHILPTPETVVAEPARVTAFGIDGAVFDGSQCRETNFKLFEPRPAPPRGSATDRRCFALRLRPNVDLDTGLEDFCRARRIVSARICGGVGSTIEARFDDAAPVTNFATEVYIREGRIVTDGRSSITAALVDYTGATAEGTITRGDNPVLMTFELVLVE